MERYEVYRDSGVEWIGEIPEKWEVVPLKALFSFGKGLPITKADLLEEGEPVISYGQIHSKANTPAHIKHELVRYVSPSFLESNAASITHKGDFLFADTSEDVEGSGNFVFHDLDERVFAGYHTLILRPTDVSYGRYLSYLFQDDQWKAQIRSRVSGVKLFSLTLRILTRASLLLPSAEEQQAIADYLDAKTAEIDALVADCEQEVELLQEYRKAVISEAVTKGLDPTVPMKDSGVEWIGKIPNAWSTARLGEVSYIRARLGWKALKAEEYVDDGYPMYSAYNIVNEKFVPEPVNYITEFRYFESPEIMMNVGDIMLVKDGAGVGKCAVIRELGGPCTVNGSIALITPNSVQDSRYLYYFFESNPFQHFSHMLMGGMGVPHLFQRDIKRMSVIQPDTTTQSDIADFLDSKTAEIDTLIKDKQTMTGKLREYRKSLISEAVTGKFKVPGVE